MKKRFLLLVTSLILLSGCSKDVKNPYEITDGKSTLSYYDTEDSITIDGFTILDENESSDSPSLFGVVLGLNIENCIIVRDGTIRYIYIVDDNIKTYKGISVGDSVDKIKDNFNYYTTPYDDRYRVLFDNGTEVNSDNQDIEDSWILITYYTDGSQIISIRICDGVYAKLLQ